MISTERYYNPFRMVRQDNTLVCAGKRFFIDIDIAKNSIKHDYRENKHNLATVGVQREGV